MIATVLDQVTGQLDKRFLLNAFFPILLFSFALGASIAAGANGLGGALESWEGLSSIVQVLIIVAWAATVFVAANLLSNGTVLITQIFEGYALPRDSLPARLGRERQHRKAHNLLSRAQASGDVVLEDEFQRTFPLSPRKLAVKDVAPTRLGNILRSAESYAEDRYGVSAVRAWPRLYHLLPETFVTSMTAARSSMEFLLVVSFLAALFVPVASIYLILSAAPLGWLYGCLVVGTVVALLAYRSSLAPARAFGGHLRAAFDLHRFKLIASLGAPQPATPEEERRLWAAVMRHLDFGTPPIWRYVPPAS